MISGYFVPGTELDTVIDGHSADKKSKSRTV